MIDNRGILKYQIRRALKDHVPGFKAVIFREIPGEKYKEIESTRFFDGKDAAERYAQEYINRH